MSFHNQYFILIIKNKSFDQEEKMRYCYICFFFFQGTEKELIKLVYLTYSLLPDDAVFNMIVFGERMLSFPFFLFL